MGLMDIGFNIAVWLVIVMITIGIAWLVRHWWKDHRPLIHACAVPSIIFAVAAVALFVTEQGRDLSVALVDYGAGGLALYAAALLYWAIAAWLLTRLQLDRHFGVDSKDWGPDTNLVKILPRLLGSLVFVIAAAAIVVAHWKAQPTSEIMTRFGGTLLATLIPLAVVAVTGAAYLLFVVYRRDLAGRLVDRRETGYRPDNWRSQTVATKGALLCLLAIALAGIGFAFADNAGLASTICSAPVAFYIFAAYLVVFGLMQWLQKRWTGPIIGLVVLVAFTASIGRTGFEIRTCGDVESSCVERAKDRIDQRSDTAGRCPDLV